MGYTHYWYRPRLLDSQKFGSAVEDCRKICQALPIPLGDWDGKGQPKFTPSEVRFNGHVNSEGFSRDGDGLVWPSEDAEALAVVGQTAVNGKWFAGSTAGARCVNSKGDGSYETFRIERAIKKNDLVKPRKGLHFGFCKTNYRPYDLCVQCCLIVFKQHFGDQFEVRSDGDMRQWHEACNDCQAILGYGLDFSLDE